MSAILAQFPLHPAQEAIASHPARFKTVACGRRFGKTTLAVHRLISELRRALPFAYISISEKNMRNVWRTLRHALQPVSRWVSEQEKRLELANGAVFEAWAAGPSGSIYNARGRAYAGVVFDEAAYAADPEIWPRVVRPMLTDHRGWAEFYSSPRGHNWFWQLYNLGLDPANSEWAAFHYPTSANPHMDRGEIESARVEMPDRLFREEYLAEFLDDGGGVFRQAAEMATLEASPPVEGHAYVFGLDWAKTEDFTVISVIDTTVGEQVYLDRFNQVSWEVQKNRVRALAERYQPALIVAEENSMGGPLIEALAVDHALPMHAFTTTIESKGQIINALALAIEQGRLRLLNDRLQLAELQAFEMERLPSGRYRYGAPSGMHDDTVIALALALFGLHQGSRVWVA